MADLFGGLADQGRPAAEERVGAARLRVPVRDEVRLEVVDLDGLIEAEHPARAIWAYAERVDFADLEAAVLSREGRPGMPRTAPHLLLALWLYATSDGVGSAREMARLCGHEPAYRWLCGGVGVNHHALSDFRTAQGGRVEALLAAHVASLSVAGLIELGTDQHLGTVVQDGVKLRAQAGAASFRRRKTLEAELVKAKAALADLAKAEQDDPGSTGRRRLGRKARAAADRAARVEAALGTMAELETGRVKSAKRSPKQTERQKEPRASTTDPEARVMRMADGGFRPAYNVQVASLPQNGIVLAVTVTDAVTDKKLAEPMAQHLQATYKHRPGTHLVDGGYQAAEDIEAAHAAKTTLIMPLQRAKSGADPHLPKPDDGPGVLALRTRMATPEAKTLYKRRACCERLHAWLRNLHLDRPTVRGKAKVQAWMAGFALAMNLLTEQRLLRLTAA